MRSRSLEAGSTSGCLFSPFFGEFAFYSGFKDGGFVAFEVGFDSLEVFNCFIKAGELFFDFCNDSFLLFDGAIGILTWDNFRCVHILDCDP